MSTGFTGQDAKKPVNSYETDFYNWTQEVAVKIREHRLEEGDLPFVAEEIEDLGKRDRKKVYSSLMQLLAHLLKWQYQPEYRTQAGETSWTVSIVKQRLRISREFKYSPSLRRYAREDLEEAYTDALALAEAETGLKGRFPATCPYSLEQILDPAFFPGE